MRALVYRNIDAATTFLGLAFPIEAGVVGTVFGAAVMLADPRVALLVGAITYALVRLASLGKPPLHVQHWVLFKIRQASGGRVSAAARTRGQTRFPYAAHQCRERDSDAAGLPGRAP